MHFRIFILFWLSLVTNVLYAQVPEYTKHVSKSYRINNSVTVDISNKYGKIQLVTWDVDSIRFDIDIRIRAKDSQKLEKLKQGVEFEFTPGQYYLVAKTKFIDSSSDVFKDIVDIAGKYLSTSNSVTINYTILVPTYVTLKIENKFGDIYFDDHDGNLNLTLSYGDLKANRLNGQSVIKLTSGDGEINYFKNGELFVSYANIHIREAGSLITQTRSSNTTIDKSQSLKLDSRRDKLFMNEIGSLSGKSYFSAVNITTLYNDIVFTGRYGNFRVDDIKRSFTHINLSSELTDLALCFEKPLSFDFELSHQQDVIFVYPKASASLTTQVVNAEEKLYRTSGNFGSPSAEPKVILNALRKCNITISQK